MTKLKNVTVPAGMFGLILVCASLIGGAVGTIFLVFGVSLCVLGLVGKGLTTKIAGIAGLALAAYLFGQMRP